LVETVAAAAGNTAKFMGIRNGIDTEIWSPFENKYLPMSYDADTLEEGKRR
jgi:glycogen synthase